jgi:Ca2+-binding EF-hand superfamily protein
MQADIKTQGEQRMKKSVLTALAVSIAVGGLGLATMASAGQRGGKMPSFETFDTNGDGIITQAEIEMNGAVKFAESDTNGDGFLDADELKAQMMERGQGRRGGDRGQGRDGKGPKDGQGNPELMQAQKGERMDLAVTHMLQRADADGDGKLSMEESRPPKAGQMFERFDADGNGEVTQQEWDAAVGQRGNRNN